MPNALLPKPQPLVERSGKEPPKPQDVGDLFLHDATALRVNTLVQEGALHSSHTRPPGLHQGRGPSRAQTSAPSLGGAGCTREMPWSQRSHCPRIVQSTPLPSGVRHLKKTSRCATSNHILRLRVSMWPHPWRAWMWPRATASRTPWSMGTTVEAQLSLTRWPPWSTLVAFRHYWGCPHPLLDTCHAQDDS